MHWRSVQVQVQVTKEKTRNLVFLENVSALKMRHFFEFHFGVKIHTISTAVGCAVVLQAILIYTPATSHILRDVFLRYCQMYFSVL